MNPKNTKNYLNGTWLHKHRETILQAVSELKTLRQISELLEPFAERENKRITPQIIHTYLKRHPPTETTVTKPIQEENAQIATNPTTEKENVSLSVTKQAADDVFSSVEESRAVKKPDFVTPTERQNSESESAPKSTNPFSKLKGKVGKSEPDFIPESSKYS